MTAAVRRRARRFVQTPAPCSRAVSARAPSALPAPLLPRPVWCCTRCLLDGVSNKKDQHCVQYLPTYIKVVLHDRDDRYLQGALLLLKLICNCLCTIGCSVCLLFLSCRFTFKTTSSAESVLDGRIAQREASITTTQIQECPTICRDWFFLSVIPPVTLARSSESRPPIPSQDPFFASPSDLFLHTHERVGCQYQSLLKLAVKPHKVN